MNDDKIIKLKPKAEETSSSEKEDTRVLSTFDEDNNLLVGQTKDECIVFAAGMQRENPDILFFQINEIFTINGGTAWTAVPVRKTHDSQQLKLYPTEVLEDIVKKVKAEKESEKKD
jgi:hypothetical protein